MKPITRFGRYCAALAVFVITVAPYANAQQRNLMEVIRQDNRGCDPNSQDCTPNSAGAGTFGSCAPGDSGAVCNMRQPAAEGDRANLSTGAGNPINIITGNKYQYEVDMPALPGVLGLELVRHYNSAISKPTDANGIIGRGWRLSYETDLFVRGDSLHIMQADGSRLIFNRDPDNPDTCANEDPARGKITIRETPQGPDYTWTWSNGRKLNFNAQGRLMQILAPTGEFVSLQRAPNGNLLKVTDPQGRSLQLRYLDAVSAQGNDRYKGVVAIDTPVGEYRYDYGGEKPKGSDIDPDRLIATLVRVHLPGTYDHDKKRSQNSDHGTTVSTVTRHYHHEDPKHPTLLTGISVIGTGTDGKFMNERISTYAYNADGKAVMSVRGEPLRRDAEGRPVAGTGIEQVMFDRSEPGKTRLTNSLGQVTVYKHGIVGGMYRIFEVFGPGCASCGETNVRYRYDRLGRLTGKIRLDHNGLPTHGEMTEYDGRGRRARISRVTYKNGKPGRAEWLERYEYTASKRDVVLGPQQVLIARPSVVAGKEHQTQITFNEFGQPIRVVESGWTPKTEDRQPAPMSRTTEYGYSSLNGRSLLTSIDGPLNNGKSKSPVDSDITLIRYDPQGSFPTEIVAPGNRTFVVRERTRSGQPTVTDSSDGVNPVRTMRISYGWRGHLTGMHSYAHESAQSGEPDSLTKLRRWMTGVQGGPDFEQRRPGILLEYDANGRPTRVSRPDGSWREARYDSGGRLAELIDQDGNRHGRIQDSENRLLDSFLQSSMSRLPLDIHTSFRYDGRNRVVRMISPQRAETEYAYDQDGEGTTAILDPLQRRTVYRVDPSLRVIELIQNAQDDSRSTSTIRLEEGRHVFVAANGASTRRYVDDFGRTMQIVNVDAGVQRAQYDQLDRLTESTDANGNTTRLLWNVAGELLERSTKGKDSVGRNDEETVKFGYLGARLVSIENANQKTEYKHDRDGRVIQRTEWLASIGYGKPQARQDWFKFSTQYEYDDLGRLRHQTLFNGKKVRFEYGRHGRMERLDLAGSQQKTIASIVGDIESHPAFGLVGFVHGNGTRTSLQRDTKSGILRRIRVDGMVSASSSHAGMNDTKLMRISLQDNKAERFIDQFLHYDTVGRITTIDHGSAVKKTSEKYEYDLFDRLQGVDNGSEQTSWSYDAGGNRTAVKSRSSSDVTQELRFRKGSNQLLSRASDQERVEYSYDAAGNTTKVNKRSYIYGVTGRLEEASIEGKAIGHYFYNGLGQRSAKGYERQGRRSEKYFLYNGSEIAAEIDDEGSVVAQYIYLYGMPIAVFRTKGAATRRVVQDESWFRRMRTYLGDERHRSEDADLYFIHARHTGAPHVVTDGQRKVIWSAEYEPFGRASISETGLELNLRLPGQYFDDESGLHYNYFRDYDPDTGRYLTSDPIGIAGGTNTYAYAEQRPTSMIDPLGLRAYRLGNTDPVITPDAGAGEWNSLPATPEARYNKSAFLGYMDRFPENFLPNAKAHMVHYFGNSGNELSLDLEQMLADVQGAGALFDLEVNAARAFAESLNLHDNAGTCAEISSSLTSVGNNNSNESMDWFLAVGGYHAWGKGVVSADSSGLYTMQFEYKIFDRYNWDAEKEIRRGSFFIPDAFLGDFHLRGLAREFNLIGSVTRTARWRVGDKRLEF